MLKHGAEKANPERFKYLYSGAKRISKDGYNSLKYRLIFCDKRYFILDQQITPHFVRYSECLSNDDTFTLIN